MNGFGRRAARGLACCVAGGLAVWLAGCGSSGDGPVTSSGSERSEGLTQTVSVTRAGCTPFGAPPRPVQPALDAAFQPSCLLTGSKLDDYTDTEGSRRVACLYQPKAAAAQYPLPLVVFIHPSIAGADLSKAASNVREGLETADLTGDPARAGFLMLEPQGRVTARYYPLPDQNGTPGWDNWYRQLQPGAASRTVNGVAYPQNVDAATIDHYIDAVVATGKVDVSRIYVMGWSNGSAMGLLYSLNRPRIAAAAVYSAPDPFHAFNDPCTQQPVAAAPKDDTELQLFNGHVPIYHVHNDCDIAGLCPNGEYLRQSLIDRGLSRIEDQIVDTALRPAQACLAICGTDPLAYYGGLDDPGGYLQDLPGYSLGVTNHLRWPFNRTADMFAFLRDHPKAQ